MEKNPINGRNKFWRYCRWDKDPHNCGRILIPLAWIFGRKKCRIIKSWRFPEWVQSFSSIPGWPQWLHAAASFFLQFFMQNPTLNTVGAKRRRFENKWGRPRGYPERSVFTCVGGIARTVVHWFVVVLCVCCVLVFLFLPVCIEVLKTFLPLLVLSLQVFKWQVSLLFRSFPFSNSVIRSFPFSNSSRSASDG